MESTKNSVAMPYESAPPFIIIVGAFCAMAGLQYVGNNIIYGKPKVRTHYLNSLLENEVVLLQPSRVALSVVVRHGYPPGGRDAQRVSAKEERASLADAAFPAPPSFPNQHTSVDLWHMGMGKTFCSLWARTSGTRNS